MHLPVRRILSILYSLALLSACGGGSGGGATLQPPAPPPPPPPPPAGAADVSVERAFSSLNFSNPVALKQAPADDTRWYVVEKNGVIRSFANDAASSTTTVFVDISTRVNSGVSEGGLLGMAFHPSFPSTPDVFVSYTASGSALVSTVSRFTLDNSGDVLDPGSEQILLQITQPQTNHNGGDIAFGPDGNLYASFGDGGGGGDPAENGQNTGNLLGTIVRINVDGAAPYTIPSDNPFAQNALCRTGVGAADCPEIFAYGLRNPWRMSFDSSTGSLWVGDVGQGAWEEINRLTVGGNYGWNDREGAHCFDPMTACAMGFEEPVTEYDHSVGQSITGGYVYRGNGVSGLSGFYVFGDYVSGALLAVAADAQPTAAAESIGDSGFNISAFAEGIDQEIYLLNYGAGSVHRLIPAP